MFDTTAPAAVASAIFYANTYYAANKSGYGLDPQQLGLMIVLRHIATPFGYNDAIWAAHGAFFAGALKDRQSVVEGKGVSVCVDLGGRRCIKKKNKKKK